MRLIAILLCTLLLFGCLGGYDSLADVNKNPEEYLGEKVTLKGNATKSVKLGKISGFTLVDEHETIPVSSEMLPPDGKEVVVKGTLMKEVLIGYYVLADEVKMT